MSLYVPMGVRMGIHYSILLILFLLVMTWRPTCSFFLLSCTFKIYRLKVKEQPLSPTLNFWHLFRSSWSEQKAHPSSAVTQSCPDSSISKQKIKVTKLLAELLGLACNVVSAQGGYLRNANHSLLSHWICWHTVSGSWLWSTRSILRFCAAVDMATILVD